MCRSCMCVTKYIQTQMSRPKYAESEYSMMNNNGELSLEPNICQKGLPKIISELDSLLDKKVLNAQVNGSTIFTTPVRRGY